MFLNGNLGFKHVYRQCAWITFQWSFNVSIDDSLIFHDTIEHKYIFYIRVFRSAYIIRRSYVHRCSRKTSRKPQQIRIEIFYSTSGTCVVSHRFENQGIVLYEKSGDLSTFFEKLIEPKRLQRETYNLINDANVVEPSQPRPVCMHFVCTQLTQTLDGPSLRRSRYYTKNDTIPFWLIYRIVRTFCRPIKS